MKKTFMDLQVGDKVWVLVYGEWPEESQVVGVTEKQVRITGSRTIKESDTTLAFKTKLAMYEHILANKIRDREIAEGRLEEAQRAVDQARDKLAEAKQEQA